MKRIFALFLVICSFAFVCVTLSSCGHTHSFDSSWTTDSKYHWHACLEAGCDGFSAMAPHSWVYDMESQADGLFDRRCSVCGAESRAEYDGMTKAEWNSIVIQDKFDNYTLLQIRSEMRNGHETLSRAVYKFTNEMAQMIVYSDGADTVGEEQILEGADAREKRWDIYIDFADLLKRDYFKYDYKSDSYRLIEPVTHNGSAFSSAIATFDNGRLVSLEVDMESQRDGVDVTTHLEMKLYDYGVTVVSPVTDSE